MFRDESRVVYAWVIEVGALSLDGGWMIVGGVCRVGGPQGWVFCVERARERPDTMKRSGLVRRG